MDRNKHAGRMNLVACLRALGFEPPVSGGDHQYMKGRGRKLRIPNPHANDVSRGLLGAHPSAGRDREGGMGIALILFFHHLTICCMPIVVN